MTTIEVNGKTYYSKEDVDKLMADFKRVNFFDSLKAIMKTKLTNNVDEITEIIKKDIFDYYQEQQSSTSQTIISYYNKYIAQK